MMNLEDRINESFNWSTITEVLVKIVTPLLNIILAHILLPEDFAPLASVTMIVTFGEIFVESGFRKYLIQHQFENKEDQDKHFDVAFWSSLAISFVIWAFVIAMSKSLSNLLGDTDISLAICISGIILPLYATCGILNSILQKNLLFKKLFIVRVVTAFVPLFITIPLAVLGLGYWSLIIGNIFGVLTQTIVLSIVNTQRIHIFFSFEILKDMLSFGIWTLLDGIAIWLTSWVDSFIIASFLNDYYLGLYKNSLSIVNSLSGLVTASVIPVLYVGLSNYQNDNEKFSDFYNYIQRILAMLLIPMGVGCFIYSDVFVNIMLGKQWAEAAGVVGISFLTSAFRTIYVGICSEAYRAKGKFRIPFYLQLLDVAILVPVCIFFGRKGFWPLVLARSIIRLDLIIPEVIILRKVAGIKIKEQIIKTLPIYFSTAIMGLFCFVAKRTISGTGPALVQIMLAIIIYFFILWRIPQSRRDILRSSFAQKIINKPILKE